MDKLKINPNFKELIPPLSQEEYTDLEELIIKEGIRDAIITWSGVIVDGHNRFEIAKKHCITDYSIKEMDFADENEAMIWIIKNQLARRNLSILARIELAKKREPLIKAEAEKRMLAGKKDPTQKSSEGTETREQLAKIAGVSHDTFRRGEKILENAPPELIQEVREGKKKINTAYREMQTGTVVCKVCGVEKPASESSVDRKSLCKDCENAHKRELKKTRIQKVQDGDELLCLETITTEEESLKNEELSIEAELPADDELLTDEIEETCLSINPNYTIDAFQVEFQANAQSYIELAEKFITGHYSPLWKNKENKEIAIAALDKAASAINNLKGLV